MNSPRIVINEAQTVDPKIVDNGGPGSGRRPYGAHVEDPRAQIKQKAGQQAAPALSQKARELSTKANASGKQEDHEAAYQAHSAAAQAHSNAGDLGNAYRHTRIAAEHDDKSQGTHQRTF